MPTIPSWIGLHPNRSILIYPVTPTKSPTINFCSTIFGVLKKNPSLHPRPNFSTINCPSATLFKNMVHLEINTNVTQLNCTINFSPTPVIDKQPNEIPIKLWYWHDQHRKWILNLVQGRRRKLSPTMFTSLQKITLDHSSHQQVDSSHKEMVYITSEHNNMTTLSITCSRTPTSLNSEFFEFAWFGSDPLFVQRVLKLPDIHLKLYAMDRAKTEVII